MDKRLILAVAGSGKTTFIVDHIESTQRVLLITYTDNNYNILIKKLRDKFHVIPKNIYVTTYFSFLYSFCFKPFYFLDYRTKGLTFKQVSQQILSIPKKNIARYITKSKYVYHCNLADFLLRHNINLIMERIKRHYDYIYIDEVQDFASYDFDFILKIAKCDINILYLGDFYQHTFDTSNSGNKASNLYKNGIANYEKKFNGILNIDKVTLSKSYRCKRNICDFISMLGMKIQSHHEEDACITPLEKENEILDCLKNDNIVKLFYKECQKYPFNSNNWGACKGSTFGDVCVITTKDVHAAIKTKFFENLSPITRNKFYVACSRASNNLFFIEGSKVKSFKKSI